MHCKRLWGALTLLLLAAIGGCKQRCFMTEADFNGLTTSALSHMDSLRPDIVAHPITSLVDAPPTLNNLDRKIRYISLAECIAIALESGTTGLTPSFNLGRANDTLITFGGATSPSTAPGVGGSDAIRVLAIDPAIAGSQIEASLSKFDAFLASSMAWQTLDQPITSVVQGGAVTTLQSQQASFTSALVKPLASGGTAVVGFGTAYQFTNSTFARVNPSYAPSLQFGFDQPLLQGFGVEINQLRAQHPISGGGGGAGNILGLTNAGGTTGANALALASSGLQFQPGGNGILISRIRFDQQRADFERNVNQMLVNVEVAYWNLYGSYWTLYSREQGLRFAFETFKLNRLKYEAGRATAADFFQSRGQYEQFRAQRLQALDAVLENERQLRALMGIPIEDGTRLMPSDSPTLAPYQPDWKTALEEALAHRPELYLARQDVKVAQMNLILQKNALLPDLRAVASYDFNGLGTRLDGPNGNTAAGFNNVNALRTLASGNFSNWTLGLRLTVPIGYRLAHVQVRQAQLALARAMEVLHDQELKTQRFLGNYYRQISTQYEIIRAQRAQREAFGEQLRARQQEFLAGRGTLDILLEAQRNWADALANEYNAIVAYNNALAGFEYAKGTILQHDNVVISEGPLPTCAQVRAVEHERARTAALVLRERAVPVAPAVSKPEGMFPGKAPSLPAVLAASPPLKDVPEMPARPDVPAANIPAPVEARIDEVFPAAPAPLTRVPSESAGGNDPGTDRGE